jgi:hypothetical protein
VTTSLASDIPDPFRLRSERCRETGRNYVVNSDTARRALVMSRDIVLPGALYYLKET